MEGPLASSCLIHSQLQRMRPKPKLIVLTETPGQPLAESGRQGRTDHQAECSLDVTRGSHRATLPVGRASLYQSAAA